MQKERPLSPHLQIYKPQLTSMLSILHRATGVFLTLGTLILVLWLWTIAAGPETYSAYQRYFSNWFFQLLLFAWTFALFYHLCNGIRHLFWDVGRGYEINHLYTSGKIVIVVSMLLSAATWAVASGYLGGVA